MPRPDDRAQSPATQPPTNELLDSWKEIAAYLNRDVRTVRRWESSEGLPVHRHRHRKGSSVYAYKAEIDAWWRNGQPRLESEKSELAEGQRRWKWLAFSAVAGAFAVGLWLTAFRQLTLSPERQWKLIPLTTDPGTETSPSFSPSGEQVAFVGKPEGSNDYDIYVKDLNSGDILQLTEGPEMEVAPAWSPDGSRIAFLRPRAAPITDPPAKVRRRLRATICSVSPFGGRELVLAELSREWSAPSYRPSRYPPSKKLSWSPDGKLLAFHDRGSPREPLSIYLLSVESGEKRKLTSPPASGLGDSTPAFSPDGRTVAFVRRNAAGRMDLCKISVEGGTPTQLTFDSWHIRGVAWTPDGREIVFSSTRSGDPNLWRVPAMGGAPRRLPSASAHAESPAVSPVGNRLAFTRLTPEANIWRLDLGGPTTSRKSVKFIASTRVDIRPVFSPDGRQVAFNSNRSGTWQVWVSGSDGSKPFQLTSLSVGGGGILSWSPDGKQIAFTSPQGDNMDIYVADARAGTVRRLTTHPGRDRRPSWSRDGRWIYFASNRSGAYQVWRMPSEGGAAVQVTKERGYRAVESPDGKFLHYTKGPVANDVWQVPIEGGEELQLLQNVGSPWTLVETGLYFFARERTAGAASEWFLAFYRFDTGQTTLVSALTGKPHDQSPPAVSPDGKAVLYVEELEQQRDLMLVENFR